MPTRAHAQKASSASPSPPSKTVPFCAGPGLKARCCPARCPQSPSTPSKLQSPSTPSKKKRARPKAYPFLFGASAGKKAAFGPLIQMLWGLKCSGGRLSPCVFFLRRIDSPKAAKKGGRKVAYAAVPAAGRGNIKAPQRRPFPLLRGQAKSRQAPSGGSLPAFLFQTDFLFQRAFQTAFQRALTGCVPRAGQGARAKRGLCLPAHGPSKSLPLSPRINCGPHTGLQAPA